MFVLEGGVVRDEVIQVHAVGQDGVRSAAVFELVDYLGHCLRRKHFVQTQANTIRYLRPNNLGPELPVGQKPCVLQSIKRVFDGGALLVVKPAGRLESNYSAGDLGVAVRGLDRTENSHYLN